MADDRDEEPTPIGAQAEDEDDTNKVTCPTCGGFGEHHDEECGACGGTGWIFE